MKGNLFFSMNRPEAAVIAFRGAQELRPDLRSYQAREAMKAMPQSPKALKLVGDVHASNTSGREKDGSVLQFENRVNRSLSTKSESRLKSFKQNNFRIGNMKILDEVHERNNC